MNHLKEDQIDTKKKKKKKAKNVCSINKARKKEDKTWRKQLHNITEKKAVIA